MERNKENEQVFGIINGTALNVSKCLLLNDLHTVYLHFFDRCYQPMPHTQCIVAIAMSASYKSEGSPSGRGGPIARSIDLLPGTRKGSSSQSPTIITRCYDFIRARPARKSRDPQTSNTEVCPTNVSSSVVVVVVIVVVPIAPTIITRCYDFIRARRARKSRDLQTCNTEVCHAQGDE